MNLPMSFFYFSLCLFYLIFQLFLRLLKSDYSFNLCYTYYLFHMILVNQVMSSKFFFIPKI